MKALLKLVSVDTIIGFVVEILESTVKNPQSPKAIGLVKAVRRLRDAADMFIAGVEGR
jgi:hypothetical protein